MDALSGDASHPDATPPHLVEATSHVASCSTDSKSLGIMKRSGNKMNKQSSGGLDDDRAKWLLAAARRVRDQKQRPNVDRIMNTLRIICPGQFLSRESVTEELERAVLEGVLLRVGPAGDSSNCSYRDPGRVVRLKTHSLHISRDLDMTKVVARSVRELADPTGSTVADVHRYIQTAYNVQIHDDSDLVAMIRKYCQKAVDVGKLVCIDRSDECRYQAVCPLKRRTVNGTKSLSSSSLSSYSLVDRAFKTDVSELYCGTTLALTVSHLSCIVLLC